MHRQQLYTYHAKITAGFGVIEVLLTIALIGLLSYIGYDVYQNYTKTTSSSGKTAQPALSSGGPYADWNSATLQYEKLSFKYPNTWALTNNSTDAATSDAYFCVHPGTDIATLSIPNGESMTLSSGLACGVGKSALVASIPITALGSRQYISILNSDHASTNKNPTEACLSTSTTSFVALPSMHIFTNKGVKGVPRDYLCFSNSSAGSSAYVHKTVDQMKSDPAFVNATLVFKSLSYN